jgi:hypothetical protein
MKRFDAGTMQAGSGFADGVFKRDQRARLSSHVGNYMQIYVFRQSPAIRPAGHGHSPTFSGLPSETLRAHEAS